jgi:hypothetical protein
MIYMISTMKTFIKNKKIKNYGNIYNIKNFR